MEHKAPTEKVFNEIKECAKHIWESNYSNEFKPYYEDVLSSQTVTVCIIDQAHTGSDGGLSVGYSHSRVDSTIGLILKSKCDNENSRSRYTAGAVASAVVKLEGGGYFCQDI